MEKYEKGIDYYEVLGVGNDFTEKELKKAYRKRALETHPDQNHGSPRDKFRRVNEAYEVLSDSDSRAKYDRLRKSGNIEKSSRRTSNSNSSSQDDFNSFYENMFGDDWFRDIFGEGWKYRAPTPEEQRRSYESNERWEKEASERKAGFEARREKKINQLWKEGMNKIFQYIKRFPDLKEKILEEDWFIENFADMYEKDGSLFYDDFGIFNNFMNDPCGTNGKELYKLFLETQSGKKCVAKIPLNTPQISGLELLISLNTPNKYRDKFFFSNSPLIGLDIKIPYCRNDIRAVTPLPIDVNKPEESLMRVCNFMGYLGESIRQGDYSIKFSETLPKEHKSKEYIESSRLTSHGFWINSLNLGGEIVIEDGNVISLINNLNRIDGGKENNNKSNFIF